METEAQDASLAVETLDAQLGGVAERMAQFGSTDDDRLIITVYRTENGEETPLEAGEDFRLQPGDMVEIEIELPPRGIGLGAEPPALPEEQGSASSMDGGAPTAPAP